jgi:hypothetical protein
VGTVNVHIRSWELMWFVFFLNDRLWNWKIPSHIYIVTHPCALSLECWIWIGIPRRAILDLVLYLLCRYCDSVVDEGNVSRIARRGIPIHIQHSRLREMNTCKGRDAWMRSNEAIISFLYLLCRYCDSVVDEGNVFSHGCVTMYMCDGIFQFHSLSFKKKTGSGSCLSITVPTGDLFLYWISWTPYSVLCRKLF